MWEGGKGGGGECPQCCNHGGTYGLPSLPLSFSFSLTSGPVEDNSPSVTWDFDADTMRPHHKAHKEEGEGSVENGEEEEEGEEGDRRRLTLVEADVDFTPQLSVDDTLLATNHRVSIVETEEGGGVWGGEGGQRNSVVMKRSSVVKVDKKGRDATARVRNLTKGRCQFLIVLLFPSRGRKWQ